MKFSKLLLMLVLSISLVLPINSFACKNTNDTLKHYVLDESINEHHAIFKAYNYRHNLLTIVSDCGGCYTYKVKFDKWELNKLKRCDFYFAYDNDETQTDLQYLIADYYNKAKDETVLVYRQ